MGRRLLKIAYLGTRYCGWQVQPNGISVQTTLQNALERLLGHRPDVCGCSRTDAGVHANCFYCHFDTESAIPDTGLVLGLNTLLPEDISALDCRRVPEDFHARYAAMGKTYLYQMYQSPVRDPFSVGRALRLKRELDLQAAEEYCSLLVGRHDFAAFSSIHRSVSDTVRTVRNCTVTVDGNRLTFSVTANGFLYHMVRIMVGSLLEYSSGRIGAADVKAAFETGNRDLLGATAPPYGLYLDRVYYPEHIGKEVCFDGRAEKGLKTES